MLSSMMYALMGDVFEKPEVAGMFGYLGGALFTLMVGALVNTIGYEPLFALLFAFDLVAAVVLWIFIGVGRARVVQPAVV
jgi:ACS family hexuronate transporter-like MFS transporter